MEKLTVGTAEYNTTVKAIMEQLLEHIKLEEEVEFPQLEATIGHEKSVTTAKSFQRTKMMVPTRYFLPVFLSIQRCLRLFRTGPTLTHPTSLLSRPSPACLPPQSTSFGMHSRNSLLKRRRLTQLLLQWYLLRSIKLVPTSHVAHIKRTILCTTSSISCTVYHNASIQVMILNRL